MNLSLTEISIDHELLRRVPGEVVLGGWCLGDSGKSSSSCSIQGDSGFLRPGSGSKRLKRRIVQLLSNHWIRSDGHKPHHRRKITPPGSPCTRTDQPISMVATITKIRILLPRKLYPVNHRFSTWRPMNGTIGCYPIRAGIRIRY